MSLHASARATSGSTVIYQSAVQATHTGDTTLTTLATITVPANTLGANGRLAIEVRASWVGTAGARTLTINVGGSPIYSNTALSSTITGVRIAGEVANRNATNVQYYGVLLTSSAGTTAPFTNGTLAIDTTTSQTITIQMKSASAADTSQLDFVTVTAAPKA